jgi:hypothetical protein
MKIEKQTIIIMLLSSFLLSAIGAAYYYYDKNEKTKIKNDSLVVVYSASSDIKKGTKIDNSHIKEITIAKKYVLTSPLSKKEILNKYAKDNIYKNDMFRKEKLSIHLSAEKNSSVVIPFKLNSYNMAYSLFRNPNYSLEKGDTINIISVYPAVEQKSNKSPNAVQYVASKIKVLGFLRDGKKSDKSIKRVKRTKNIKGKTIVEEVNIKANELLLDIDSKVLLNLIDDFNRGNQLWMVKTHPKVEKVKKQKIVKSNKKRSYPYRLYKARNKTNSIKATIHYGDEKDASKVKNAVVKIDKQKICENTDNYLIGLSNKVHLRVAPGNKRKIKRIVYKNYFIPYIKEENKYWYQTCDGYYVNKLEAKKVSKKYMEEKLGKRL